MDSFLRIAKGSSSEEFLGIRALVWKNSFWIDSGAPRRFNLVISPDIPSKDSSTNSIWELFQEGICLGTPHLWVQECHLVIPPNIPYEDSSGNPFWGFLQKLLLRIFFTNSIYGFFHKCLLWITPDSFMDYFLWIAPASSSEVFLGILAVVWNSFWGELLEDSLWGLLYRFLLMISSDTPSGIYSWKLFQERVCPWIQEYYLGTAPSISSEDSLTFFFWGFVQKLLLRILPQILARDSSTPMPVVDYCRFLCGFFFCGLLQEVLQRHFYEFLP